MKIFYVNRFSGEDPRLFQYLQDIIANKKDYEILFIGPNEKDERYSSNRYIEFVHRVWKYDNYVLSIYNYLKKYKPDIIYFNFELRIFGSIKSAIKFPLLLFLIHFTKTKVVTTLHQIFIERQDTKWEFFDDYHLINIPKFILKFLIKIFVKAVCRYSDKIVIHTHGAKSGLIEYYRIDEKKIEVNHLAIVPNTSINQQKKKKFEALFNQKKIILCFGLIAPRKGIETAIKSLKIITEKLPDYVLVIAGSSTEYYRPYENMLRQLTKTLDLEEKIFFTGFLDDDEVNILFNMSEIVVYPYAPSCSFSYAVLHAIHHNKPTIVTNINTFKEVLQENDALFIEPNNEKQLADAIFKIATNSDLRTQLRLQMKSISGNYSWQKTAAKYMKIYEELATPKDRKSVV